MIKSEINEIKKLYNIKKNSIKHIAGCYVDGEKNKKATISQSFFSLPEEEMYKYFEILKKCLSGTIGKNLVTLDFPLAQEAAGGTQEFLLQLRDSELKDESLLDAFYDKIIASYDYVGNYLILLIYDVYDVPGKTSDGLSMDDASDEIFSYILACICPVNLSKSGLSYNALDNMFHERPRDWVVDMPETAFLFPAFHDRSTDIHSTLFYKKDAEAMKDTYIEQIFGCTLPMSAGNQKATFHTIIEDTLGDDCDMEIVKNIHGKLTELTEKAKEDPAPLVLDKSEMKSLLSESGVSDEKLEIFDKTYEAATANTDVPLYVSNVANTRSFEIKSPDVIVKVKPDATGLLETREIGGRQCLIIALDGEVVVNGITISTPTEDPEE